MRQRDSKRHQFGSLITGVAKYHSLIAGTVIQFILTGFLCLQRLIYTQGNIIGLLINIGNDSTGIAVESTGGVIIACVKDHLPGNLGNIHTARGGDLPHNENQSCGDSRLTGHAAIGIHRKNSIQNSVADLIADLIGMPLGNRFGSKQI